jgi:RNA-directed DNA polymerase
MAVKLILEPIFEADFLDVSYGYRPARSAHDALQKIERNVREGYNEIYDADIQAYFDTIPHDKLMKCVERRVTDGAVLSLIRQWLKAPVEERDGNDRPTRSRPTQGTPQGGVISPLLANIYLHWMDVTFNRSSGPGVWAEARLVRYADDFVIMAKHMDERIEAWVDGTVEGWLGLAINRTKTRIVRLKPESNESLDFLGYTFRYERDLYVRGKRYLVMKPSRKSIARMRAELRDLISRRSNFVPLPQLVGRVNLKLRGWRQYFSIGYPRRAHRTISHFTISRLTRHLKRRSQRPCCPPAGMTWYGFVTDTLGFDPLLSRSTP